MTQSETSTGKILLALGFLGLAGFAFYSMVLDGDAEGDGGPVEVLDPMVDEPVDDVLAPEGAETLPQRGHKAAVIRADLLSRFGTLPPAVQVGSPFRTPQVVEANASGARAGEGTDGEWRPPQLNVTLVFHAGPVRRASVDGVVVGVGDPLGGGIVGRIERDGLELRLDGTQLFYDLRSPYPRGYAPPADSGDVISGPDGGGDDPLAGDDPRLGRKP